MQAVCCKLSCRRHATLASATSFVAAVVGVFVFRSALGSRFLSSSIRSFMRKFLCKRLACASRSCRERYVVSSLKRKCYTYCYIMLSRSQCKCARPAAVQKSSATDPDMLRIRSKCSHTDLPRTTSASEAAAASEALHSMLKALGSA